jgi:site-specific DNA-methyltransferase (adenine-specific)
MIQLLQGDCIELMKTLPDKSVDAIITDPPLQYLRVSGIIKAWKKL